MSQIVYLTVRQRVMLLRSRGDKEVIIPTRGKTANALERLNLVTFKRRATGLQVIPTELGMTAVLKGKKYTVPKSPS